VDDRASGPERVRRLQERGVETKCADLGACCLAQGIGADSTHEQRLVPQALQVRRDVQRRAAEAHRVSELVPQNFSDDQRPRTPVVVAILYVQMI